MRLLLSLVLIFSLLSSLSGNCFSADHCLAEIELSEVNSHDDTKTMTVQQSSGHSKELTDYQSHDCSCPVHGAGCVHFNQAAVSSAEKWIDNLAQILVSRVGISARDQMKVKGPYLEKPFQPPRV